MENGLRPMVPMSFSPYVDDIIFLPLPADEENDDCSMQHIPHALDDCAPSTLNLCIRLATSEPICNDTPFPWMFIEYQASDTSASPAQSYNVVTAHLDVKILNLRDDNLSIHNTEQNETEVPTPPMQRLGSCSKSP